MEHRIYGDKRDIDVAHTKDFWDMRARSVPEQGTDMIMCADQAKKERGVCQKFDEEFVIPRLNITPDTRILDIGCGVGRMAKMILPACAFYCGTDFSEEMIHIAERECAQIPGIQMQQYRLYPLSLDETTAKEYSFYGGKFDAAIISGVCPYVNDEELQRVFLNMPKLMNAHSTIYLQHPVGLNSRLTLDHFYSESMDAQYSAIYRTADEYLALYKPLMEAGFTLAEQGYKPKELSPYSDTDRWYVFLKR